MHGQAGDVFLPVERHTDDPSNTPLSLNKS